MPPQTVGEWSAPRQTGERVIGGDGGSGSYGMPGAIPSPRKFDQSRLEISDMNGLDPDVARQLENGLIDANDIADPNGQDFEDAPRQVFRRKVKKMVEVPVIRKVKVPTSHDRVVPVKETQTIQVKKTIPVQEKKMVEEAYTDIEDRQATRMKEVWIKKMVPEQYTKKVEVRKTRKVEVPYTTYKEVTEDKQVEVETTKVEKVPGWRLDEVKDTKMVEIEGWQEVELVPRLKADGNVRIEKTFERQCPRRRVERKMGTNIVGDDDARLDEVDTDSSGDEQAEITTVGNINLDGSERRTKAPRSIRKGAPRSHRFLTSAPAPPAVAQEQSPAKTLVPTPPPKAEETAPSPRSGAKMFGLRMNARKEGLFISEVAPGGFAEDAGLKSGDTIISVDGRTLSSVKEWRAVLAEKESGEFLTMVLKADNGRTRPVALKLDGFNPAHYV